ncbi:MAG: universal stress protein [Planctomycetia bacterium]|nr:universal stress protein [Planctomycetia bacterium]
MRSSQRLLAVLLFAAVSLLALASSGLLDWITSSLFLILEFLAEFLRRVFGLRRSHRPPAHDRTPARHRTALGFHRPRRLAHRKGSAVRKRPGSDDGPSPEPEPKVRVLLPLTADHPGMIAFGLAECRVRKAELLFLFLRPLAVMPMGPNPLPTLTEDSAARALFERVVGEAQEAGVTIRTLYEVTHDRTASILEVARNHQADVLLMRAARRNRFWNALAGDTTQSILGHLPEHVSLVVHAA